MEPGQIQGSGQGANRAKIIREVSQLSQEKFQASQVQSEQTKQLGGSRSPLQVVTIGGNEINSGASTSVDILPEIGKGSIADLFL